MKSEVFVILLLVVILIFGTVGISSASETLVFGISVDVDHLEPGYTIVGYVVDNIFEGLVKFKAGTTIIEPCLATSWEISEDGKEITFHLRKGVKFHDGTDFNSDAVVFSFARQYDPNHPYHQYGKWYYFGYMFLQTIQIFGVFSSIFKAYIQAAWRFNKWVVILLVNGKCKN